MKWFKHDSDATQDAKIKKLLIRYGVTGYAIYFHCLELIAGNVTETNLTFELEHDSEIIADNLRIQGTSERSGISIVEEIMRFIVDIGLFSQSGDRIFCFKLLKRLDASMASDGFRKLIIKAKESHDVVMTESCPSHDNIMLDKKRLEENRVEEKKEENIAPATPSPAPQKRFQKPTLTDISEYIAQNNLIVDAETFLNHYEGNGWMVGRVKMKNWQKTIENWNKRELEKKREVKKPARDYDKLFAELGIKG